MRIRIDSKSGAYVAAVAVVGAASIIRLALGLVDPTLLKFATYYPAVLVAALFGGVGPGVLAMILSVIAVWFAIMQPAWSFSITSVSQVLDLGLFAACAVVLIWIASAYRREQHSREVLMLEMEHRNKNTQAVVNAIVSKTLKDQPAVARVLNGRLAALYATNEILTRSADQTTTLDALLDAELHAYERARVSAKGPVVPLDGARARCMALVIHELATNAAKYGALSNPLGKLHVEWARNGDAIDFVWSERDGPPVTAPMRQGFGTALITRLLQGYGGTFQPEFAKAGFVAHITINTGSAG